MELTDPNVRVRKTDILTKSVGSATYFLFIKQNSQKNQTTSLQNSKDFNGSNRGSPKCKSRK